MITKEAERKDGTSSYTRLIEYLTDDMGLEHRVGRIRTSNLHTTEHDELGLRAAIEEVELNQARNTTAQEKVLHLVLSFHEKHLPSSTLHEIEDYVVKKLGYEDHRRISVEHNETDHTHLHIAIDKIYVSPKTGRHICRFNDFGHNKLDRLAVELERKYGLQPDNHRWLQIEPAELAREGLVQRLQQTWAQEVQQARSWSEVFRLSKAHGIQLQESGKTGLRLVQQANGAATAASAIGREFSRNYLERRLGPLQLNGQPRPNKVAKTRQQLQADLTSRLKQQASKSLREAGDWAAFHGCAAQNGVRVLERGGGLAFEDLVTGELAKASAVASRLSLGQLRKRLGPYEAPEPLPASVQAREQIIQAASVEAERSHQQRRATIEVMGPSAIEHWHRLSARTWEKDQERIRELRQVELHLEQQIGADWRQQLGLQNPQARAPSIELATLQQILALQRLHKQPKAIQKQRLSEIVYGVDRPRSVFEPHSLFATRSEEAAQGYSLQHLSSRTLVQTPHRSTVPLPSNERRELQQQGSGATRNPLRRSVAKHAANQSLEKEPTRSRSRGRGRSR